jgi:hypothetical protein
MRLFVENSSNPRADTALSRLKQPSGADRASWLFSTRAPAFGARAKPANRCRLWVIRDRVEPVARPAMSALPPKAEHSPGPRLAGRPQASVFVDPPPRCGDFAAYSHLKADCRARKGGRCGSRSQRVLGGPGGKPSLGALWCRQNENAAPSGRRSLHFICVLDQAARRCSVAAGSLMISRSLTAHASRTGRFSATREMPSSV